jgi:hypothetical protein
MAASVDGVEGENLVESVRLFITQDAENALYDTGATPEVTLAISVAGITAPHTVVATDEANPIIIEQIGISGTGTEYTKANLLFSEEIEQTGPSIEFQAICPLVEGTKASSCVYANIATTKFGPGLNTTNTYTLTYSTSSLELEYADASKYVVSGLFGTPLIYISQDGFVRDLADNPLTANATIKNITLLVTARDSENNTVEISTLEPGDVVSIQTQVTYFNDEESQIEDLPNSVVPKIVLGENVVGTFQIVGIGSYELTITDNMQSTEDIIYTVRLSDPRLPMSESKSLTVTKVNITDNQPAENGGGSGGGGILPTNKAPLAVIKEIGTTLYSGIQMSADGSLSTDPDNDPIFYSWNFGDNTTTTELSTLDKLMTHTYTNPGTYTITLSIQDSNQAVDSTSTIVTVLQGTEVVEDTTESTTSTTPTTQTPTTPTNPTTPAPTTPVDYSFDTETTQTVTTDVEESEETVTVDTDTADAEQASIEETPSSDEELPDWLAWLFGSSTAVAAVWTGLLANRYRKYVA